jgi:hypothetical protein
VNWNKHYDLRGKHAFLSPSKFHWINYDEEKLASTYSRSLALQRGLELHALACRCIELGVKLPSTKLSLNQYVNDAIGYRMTPEQVVFYSVNAFGTADTISFRNRRLRIHDLKTGSTRVSMRQLEIYTALFCLEYEIKPHTIDIELRVYQSSSIIVHEPEAPDIRVIMDKIITFDKIIEAIKTEEEGWL